MYLNDYILSNLLISIINTMEFSGKKAFQRLLGEGDAKLVSNYEPLLKEIVADPNNEVLLNKLQWKGLGDIRENYLRYLWK